MVKLGGNEKHVNYVKTSKFYEIRGKIWKSRGKNNFPEIGGGVIYNFCEDGGNSKFKF